MTTEQATPWLTFALEETLYCLPVARIREVVPWLKPEPVPAAPGVVEGVINLRGDIVTVVNGRLLLGLEEVPANGDSRILTLDLGRETLGLTVDSVSEIIELKASDIEPPPQALPALLGSCQVGTELVVALSMHFLRQLAQGGVEWA